MIIEKKSEIKVLRNFYSHPFNYCSVAEISKETNISRNWIYKIIEKFEEYNILSKSGKKYKLNFSTPFCKKLKLLFDAEYVMSLNQDIRTTILSIRNKIMFESNPDSIVLVGSVALNKQKKNSDIDFLVMGKNKTIPQLENCNIVMLNEKEFKEKYLKGDDFIISALLFGKIIYDKETFVKFLESPLPIFSQELIQEKIKYCEKLKERIYALLKSDQKRATEEVLYLALQTGRIILLKNDIAPQTKHDIAEQVNECDKKLAKIIKELLKKKKLDKETILNYVQTCMNKIP